MIKRHLNLGMILFSQRKRFNGIRKMNCVAQKLEKIFKFKVFSRIFFFFAFLLGKKCDIVKLKTVYNSFSWGSEHSLMWYNLIYQAFLSLVIPHCFHILKNWKKKKKFYQVFCNQSSVQFKYIFFLTNLCCK